MKYLKVMFGDSSRAKDGYQYKIGEVNVASNWNPKDLKHAGGFFFSVEDKIARWLVRGDTLYDVEIPNDGEIISIPNESAPGGVFQSNKIIIKNPRKVTEEMALFFYRKSKLPEKSYFKTLAGYAIRGYLSVCQIIIEEKIHQKNIDEAIFEYEDFYQPNASKESQSYEDYQYVLRLLYEKKEEYLKDLLFITEDVDKDPYLKTITDDMILNLTGESGSGKSTYTKDYIQDSSYVVVDTDFVFSSKEVDSFHMNIRNAIMEEYGRLPSLFLEFDLCYQAILNYFQGSDKFLIIDSAQFRNMKDLSLLRGEVMVLRTCVDTCFQRCMMRYDKKFPNSSLEDKNQYIMKKKNMYQWYHSLNNFILKVDKL